ncbi:hypothetical protein ASD51_16675 [Streptomyces sp. Root55]|nr:hypothetical protein ASD26_03515 [Streptomyces sp. Root1319]KQZ04464.1 hypothetical protein ASD51_16675 [Streptomyces sp. Root55]
MPSAPPRPDQPFLQGARTSRPRTPPSARRPYASVARQGVRACPPGRQKPRVDRLHELAEPVAVRGRLHDLFLPAH